MPTVHKLFQLLATLDNRNGLKECLVAVLNKIEILIVSEKRIT